MQTHPLFDIGDEVTSTDHRRTGVVMDLMTDHTLMVMWEDEPFCRMVRVEDVLRPSYVTMVHNPRHRRSLLGVIVFALCAGLIVSAVLWMMATPAKAAEPEHIRTEIADCIAAHRTPHSRLAAACRSRGWVVRPRLVVGPRGVVRYSHLPHCRYEDGSGQRSACSWNFTGDDYFGGVDGNGYGLVLWNDRHDRAHYVWPLRMDLLSGHWQWVSRSLADALAEGEHPNRRWERCLVRYGATTTVICPDGYRERS